GLPGEGDLPIVRALHGAGVLRVWAAGTTIPSPGVRLVEGVVASDHPDDVAPFLRGEVDLRVLDIGCVPRVVQVLLRSPGTAGIGPIRDVMGRVSREDPVDKERVLTCVLVRDIEASFRRARACAYPDLP